ncbi:MAG: helix-turn-helix domain-containing protein [Actinomycetota bacterium]|nr:helix-turn-helix domain-containing protein [Actinomycetota bacterium]
MTEPSSDEAALAAVLADPIRRAVYDWIRRADAAMTVDQTASALGLARSTAGFHLDRLVREGALRVEHRKAAGRVGPGSGRPAKFYSPASSELAVSLPTRDYELVGELLAGGIEAALAGGRPVDEALREVAESRGRRLGAEAGDLETALRETGYEPVREGDGFQFTNCPFHRLARAHTGLVCGLNGALLNGVLEGCGANGFQVQGVAPPEPCCARITRAAGASQV